MASVGAVLTVFNRRGATIRCLRSLRGQATDVDLAVYLVDDASTDGTAEAVRSEFPEVHLINGDGNQFWNGGMRLAFAAALSEGHDYYWWLNDDVELDSGALTRLIDTDLAIVDDGYQPGIIVGSMRDPDDGHLTYGGVARGSRLKPFSFDLVAPTDVPVTAITMNGNCVLIPRHVAHVIGNISPEYRQKMGDYDYGLRAGREGFKVWVAPGTHGTCATHPPRRTDVDPLVDEIRRLWSVKELPFGPWATFTRRWGGPFWPIYFFSPYVRRSIQLIVQRARSLTIGPR